MTDQARRPNIVLIMSDEHAPQCMGNAGHPWVQTPHLDALAARGVTFDSAYCNSPLCVPSRASFMSGQHLHRVGVWDNGVPLASDQLTWAHLLRLAGYETVLSGKMHFIGPDQLHGFERRLVPDIHRTLVTGSTWEVRDNPRASRRVQSAGPGRAAHLDYDDTAHAAAFDYLRQWAAGDRSRPFALCVSYTAPHFPLLVDEEYFSLYWPHRVDMPVLPPGHLEHLHPAMQRLRRWFGVTNLTPEETRRARAAYYGLVSYTDNHVGELLTQLEQLGLDQETVVVYVSDHGEMAGEHGLWWKCCFYEWSARVPCIFAWPGHFPAGRRLSQVVSLVDVVATLVDLAGAPDHGSLDGDSLLDLLQGRPRVWKDEAFCEYYAHGVGRAMCMLRRGRYKLNYVHGEAPELYDLEADPGEFHDLAGDPAYADVVEGMRARILAGWDPQELEQRVRASQRERTLLEQAEAVGRPPQERPAIEN